LGDEIRCLAVSDETTRDDRCLVVETREFAEQIFNFAGIVGATDTTASLLL